MAVSNTKTEALLKLAKKGAIRSRDLKAIGVPRSYLQRLCERGLLERVGRGIYQLADTDPTELHSLAQVALRVPHGIVCLLSALQFHELTSELPHEIWLMIESKARKPTLSSPSLSIVRASGEAFAHGVLLRKMEGVSVKITSPAKTVADCFRYRKHVGLDVALEALRDYLRTRRSGVDALVRAAKADRVYTFMRPYIEAMV